MLIAFEAPPMRRVDPSGADFITYSDAILVMAPGRFSMMNCCFRTGASRSVSARVTRSVFPPAANGLTMRTTLDGAWAPAPDEIAPTIMITGMQTAAFLKRIVMFVSMDPDQEHSPRNHTETHR